MPPSPVGAECALPPGLQVPEFRTTEEVPYLSAWRHLSQLAAIRGNVLFRQGQEQKAIEQALHLIQLGSRMEDSKGALLHYLVGSAVKSQGLAQLRRWAGRAHLIPFAAGNCTI